MRQPAAAADDMPAIFYESLLDAEAVHQAKAARDELAGIRWEPFTQRTHEDVYSFCVDAVQRISPKTAVSVCHGTPTTWEASGKKDENAARELHLQLRWIVRTGWSPLRSVEQYRDIRRLSFCHRRDSMRHHGFAASRSRN